MLEKFFERVEEFLRSNKGKLLLDRKIPKQLSMSQINKILVNDPKVKKAVFAYFRLKDVPIPTFPDEYLYGGISHIIHNPSTKTVFISKEAPEDYKTFFLEIVKLCGKNIEEFDQRLADMEAAASSGY